jgi:hypothetical protein
VNMAGQKELSPVVDMVRVGQRASASDAWDEYISKGGFAWAAR